MYLRVGPMLDTRARMPSNVILICYIRYVCHVISLIATLITPV